MIKDNFWIESTSRPQGREDIIQLLVVDKATRSKVVDEPFVGLTAEICEWIEADDSLQGCVDICVVEGRKFITLKFATPAGASEVSE